MNLPVIAGTVSTGIFVLSMLPMLQKACKTKDLRSYSLGSLWLSNGGNLVHSVYVYSLAPGPIWFLHSFYLVATALMLIWYVCYERRIHILMVVKQHGSVLARSINQLRGHAGTAGVASPRPPERACEAFVILDARTRSWHPDLGSPLEVPRCEGNTVSGVHPLDRRLSQTARNPSNALGLRAVWLLVAPCT